MIAFRQFLRKYGITLLPVSVKSIQPGDILEKKNRGYYPYTHLNKIVNDPDTKWQTRIEAANIVQEKVSRTLSLKGKYSLKSMGVDIGGGLSKAKSATYTITGVKARVLKNVDTMYVEEKLADIKSKNKTKWKYIRGKRFIELGFYATEFTIDFDVDGDIGLKGEIGGNISHGAEASVKWTTKTRIKVTQNNEVPFGFKGFKI